MPGKIDDDPRAAPPSTGDELPARIGRFIVLGPLGRGGMGVVVRAYDPTLDRQVAVKLMHPGLGRRHRGRLLREAQALARLSHPNVVQVYEVGEHHKQPFIAMELVFGQTLMEWNQQRHSWRRCLAIYAQAGRGLMAAHAAGLTHRDFKPSNCILDDEGRVRVLDFGLAQGRDATEPESSSSTAPPRSGISTEDLERIGLSDDSHRAFSEPLTRPGAVMGTLAYMAPEQMRSQPTDARTDQFSFCVSLYEALFGERPFESNPVGLRLDKPTGKPSPLRPPPGRHGVPRWLLRALGRGMAADPDLRWPSMDALVDELRRRRRRRSWGWLAMGVSAASLAVTMGMGIWGARSPCADEGRHVAGVWGPGPRARVVEALRATGVGYAELTAVRVSERLDDYTDELSGAYFEACEATKVHSEENNDELELRQACLDQRVAAVRQRVAVLAQADGQVVERAVQSVMDLPSLEPCAHGAALLRVAKAAPPRDLDEEQQLRDLREQLETARSLQSMGKTLEGLAQVELVVRAAEDLSDPPLLAEALLVTGLLRTDLGKHERAEQDLRRALDLALAHGADPLRVEILSTLAALLGVEQAESSAALWLAEVAQGLVKRTSADLRLRARVMIAMGQVRAERGDHAHAQAQFEQAIALLTQARGPNQLALAVSLDSLGVSLRRQGYLDLATEKYRRALELRRQVQGDRHPETAHLLVNLAVVLNEQGKFEQAERCLHEALDILGADPVKRHAKIAHAHTILGIMLEAQARFEEARHALERAVTAWEAGLGPQHPKVARVRLNLGTVLVRIHQREAAIDQFEQALSILEAHPRTAKNRETMTEVLDRLIEQYETLGDHQRAAARRKSQEQLEGSTAVANP
ncbi:MAG: serine/threonine-protein kinase [Myxococcota bacterium]